MAQKLSFYMTEKILKTTTDIQGFIVLLKNNRRRRKIF
jgi:hypothetical protein